MPKPQYRFAAASALAAYFLLSVPASAEPACQPASPNGILQWASPKNWLVLSLGGATNVMFSDSQTPDAVETRIIGISQPGDLVVSGASMVRSMVLLNMPGSLHQSGPSYVSGLAQDPNSEAYLRLARSSALAGADCAASLPATLDRATIVIPDSSGNLTIEANDRNNVLNLGDLLLTNATLTLSSHFGEHGNQPSIIVNVFGSFRLEGASRIALAGTLDADHVLFNIVGPGPAASLSSGSIGSDGLPTTQISGVLLAASRDIVIAPGLVTGSVIGGGKTISFTSGSQVVRPPEQTN